MIYNIILFACFCFALCEGIYAKTLLKTSTNVEINEKCEKLEKKLFIFVIAYMIFICGMRAYKGINYVGIDTRNYYTMYLLQKSLTFKDIINNGDFDIGYTLLSWLFIKLDWEFAAIILCAAIVFVGSVAVFIYKYSKNRFMSIFVFVAMGLYFFGFTAIRQTLAMGICVCAYMFAQKNTGFKSLVVFVLLVWLASTIHASAIVFFPAYILQKMPCKTSIVVTL
ncbi:MAG: EpsG family protein [Clostridia bacterium]|nr:EpsG family protein [Clostridia bacterium]